MAKESTINELQSVIYHPDNFKLLHKGYRGFNYKCINKFLHDKEYIKDGYNPDLYGLLDWIDAYYDVHKFFLRYNTTFYPIPLWREAHFTPSFIQERVKLAVLMVKNEAKDKKQLLTSRDEWSK